MMVESEGFLILLWYFLCPKLELHEMDIVIREQ